jgi:hypothetical protein
MKVFPLYSGVVVFGLLSFAMFCTASVLSVQYSYTIERHDRRLIGYYFETDFSHGYLMNPEDWWRYWVYTAVFAYLCRVVYHNK